MSGHIAMPSSAEAHHSDSGSDIQDCARPFLPRQGRAVLSGPRNVHRRNQLRNDLLQRVGFGEAWVPQAPAQPHENLGSQYD